MRKINPGRDLSAAGGGGESILSGATMLDFERVVLQCTIDKVVNVKTILETSFPRNIMRKMIQIERRIIFFVRIIMEFINKSGEIS